MTSGKRAKEFCGRHDSYPAIQEIVRSPQGDLIEVGDLQTLAEIAEGGVHGMGGHFAFNRKPGPLVHGDQKINFPFRYVAQIMQTHPVTFPVFQEMTHFQEVPGDQIFKAAAFIGDDGPVPEVGLGSFAQGTNGAVGIGRNEVTV